MASIPQLLFKWKTQRRRLQRWVERRVFPHRQLQLLFEELLLKTGQTLALDELLVMVPKKLSQGLQLSSMTIFLREKTQFVAQKVAGEQESLTLSFLASCSTVSNLRRRHDTVQVDMAKPDAWLLLATAEELDTLKKVHADLLVPLEGRTGIAGFMAIAKTEGKRFSSYERRSLRSLGMQMGIGFETARFIQTLSDEAVARAKLKKELELAREVQARLLPQALPVIEGMDVAAHYQSAEEIGGDYYDAFETPGGLVCYVVADVSGKGVSAALLMATLRAALRSLVVEDCSSTPRLVASLNNLLFDASSASRYATMFFMLYDPGTNVLTYVNAGHNPPLFVRGGKITRLESGGAVVGLLRNLQYEQGVVQLDEGDAIVAYTDGVTEAVNTHGEEWGEERLRKLLLEHPEETASNTVDTVVSALTAFAAGAQQHDDITVFVLRRTPSSLGALRMTMRHRV